MSPPRETLYRDGGSSGAYIARTGIGGGANSCKCKCRGHALMLSCYCQGGWVGVGVGPGPENPTVYATGVIQGGREVLLLHQDVY